MENSGRKEGRDGTGAGDGDEDGEEAQEGKGNKQRKQFELLLSI